MSRLHVNSNKIFYYVAHVATKVPNVRVQKVRVNDRQKLEFAVYIYYYYL